MPALVGAIPDVLRNHIRTPSEPGRTAATGSLTVDGTYRRIMRILFNGGCLRRWVGHGLPHPAMPGKCDGHRMNERVELWRRTSQLASWSTATGLATWRRAAVETDELTEVGRVFCVCCGLTR